MFPGFIIKKEMLEMVAGAVRKSKSDIVLSTLAVSLYTEQGHIGCSAYRADSGAGLSGFPIRNTSCIHQARIDPYMLGVSGG